jgi:hypothetical protein
LYLRPQPNCIWFYKNTNECIYYKSLLYIWQIMI